MSDQTKSGPLETFRDGAIEISIWPHQPPQGKEHLPPFSFKVDKRYQDDAGDYHSSNNYFCTELERLAKLATTAVDTAKRRMGDEPIAAAPAE